MVPFQIRSAFAAAPDGLERRPVKMVLQGAERAIPVARQRGQELLRYLHRRGAQPVPDAAPLARLARDQAGLGQAAQVLGDPLPGDWQPGGQVGSGGRAARGQRGQDGAPARVGQGREHLLGDRLAIRPRHRGS